MAKRKMKMTRGTAELIVNCFQSVFAQFGLDLERALNEPGMEHLVHLMPKNISKFFKYGTEREGIIKYLMTHGSEPTAGHREAMSRMAVELPLVIRKAFMGGPPFRLPKSPTHNYRLKISREEREQVPKMVNALKGRGRTFAAAIKEVSEEFGVHNRTIRRICHEHGVER